jgi:glycosyltransferase involved in cell wall biosynthesis
MKVILFTRALDIGGSQRQLRLLANGLALRGHQVVILTLYPGGALAGDFAGSVRLRHLEKRGRWDVVSPLIELRRLLRAEHPDVLYAFLPTQTAIAAALLPRGLRTRLVFGVRAGALKLKHYDTLSRLLYRLEARLSKRADLVIANAQAARVDAVARGFPANRMAVVPNGIDTNRMKPDRDAGRAFRRQWSIPDDAFVIGMVARLDPMKDHCNLLEAAAVFAQGCPDAWFVCIGDGPDDYRDHLTRRAASLGLAGRLTWTGALDDVGAAYNAFDLATLPSAFGEAFPNVVGEAMACGTPVVATSIGDVATIVGSTGVCVPPARPDLLCAAWTRMRQRLAAESGLGAEARQRIVDNYSVDAMVSNTEALLTALHR